MDISYNRVLGYGTYGKVVKRDTTAVKHYNMDTKAAFIREVSALKRLKHANLQELLGVCYGEIVMPLCVSSLRDLKNISRDHMKQIMKQSIMAVSYIHSQGFWHRDITPSNILVKKMNSRTLTIVISDMNTCTRYMSDRKHTMCPTTYRYAPPEMLAGILNYTQSVDIWSLGMTLLEVFSSSPFISCCNKQDSTRQRTTLLTQILNKLGCITTTMIPGIVGSDIFRDAHRRASPSRVCDIPDVPGKYTLQCMLQISPEARSFNRVVLIEPPPITASIRLSGYASMRDREIVAMILAQNCIEMQFVIHTLEVAIEIMDDCTHRERVPPGNLGMVAASALYLAHILCEAEEFDESSFVFTGPPRLFTSYTEQALAERVRITLKTCEYNLYNDISVSASEFALYIWSAANEMINSINMP